MNTVRKHIVTAAALLLMFLAGSLGTAYVNATQTPEPAPMHYETGVTGGCCS